MNNITESVEEYLERLWIFEEKGRDVVKINEISRELKISPPSVVEMLKKMKEMGLVKYETRVGISLTKEGRSAAKQVIRSHRLAELLLTDMLNMKLDKNAHENVCGMEHHISEEIADAVCTSLNHPRKCPHGNDIPEGECCSR